MTPLLLRTLHVTLLQLIPLLLLLRRVLPARVSPLAVARALRLLLLLFGAAASALLAICTTPRRLLLLFERALLLGSVFVVEEGNGNKCANAKRLVHCSGEHIRVST